MWHHCLVEDYIYQASAIIAKYMKERFVSFAYKTKHLQKKEHRLNPYTKYNPDIQRS